MAEIIFAQELHSALRRGNGALAGIAASNFGPSGSTTVYDEPYDIPMVVRQASRIAKDFSLPDRTEILEEPYILVADRKLESILPLQKLLVELIERDAALLLIVRDMSPALVSDLLANVRRGCFGRPPPTPPDTARAGRAIWRRLPPGWGRS